ncbi:PEP-CTERM sorting domain-containing protein [Poriferisphaera sp. WC338]|uniref:PEP-CTERM sorting domain-containing protein n=1 Tax=Poriferisphaera sp. WC338 TaxID=3425129 RepID=UPI003D81BED7
MITKLTTTALVAMGTALFAGYTAQAAVDFQDSLDYASGTKLEDASADWSFAGNNGLKSNGSGVGNAVWYGNSVYTAAPTAGLVDGTISTTFTMSNIENDGHISVFARQQASGEAVVGRVRFEPNADPFYTGSDTTGYQISLDFSYSNATYGNSLNNAKFWVDYFPNANANYTNTEIEFELILELSGADATLTLNNPKSHDYGATWTTASHSITTTIDNANLLSGGTAGLAFAQKHDPYAGINDGADTLAYLTPNFTNFSAVETVPEPASFALLGLGGLALLRRRK